MRQLGVDWDTDAARLWVHAKGRFEQVVHVLGDLDVQAGEGVEEDDFHQALPELRRVGGAVALPGGALNLPLNQRPAGGHLLAARHAHALAGLGGGGGKRVSDGARGGTLKQLTFRRSPSTARTSSSGTWLSSASTFSASSSRRCSGAMLCPGAAQCLARGRRGGPGAPAATARAAPCRVRAATRGAAGRRGAAERAGGSALTRRGFAALFCSPSSPHPPPLTRRSTQPPLSAARWSAAAPSSRTPARDGGCLNEGWGGRSFAGKWDARAASGDGAHPAVHATSPRVHPEQVLEAKVFAQACVDDGDSHLSQGA